MTKQPEVLKQNIKKEINKLYRIRKLPEFPWFRASRSDQHCTSYHKIKNMACANVHNFAQMIADGEISEEFTGMLSERGGAVSPLYPGVLDILLGSEIEGVLHFANWYEDVHLKYHERGR